MLPFPNPILEILTSNDLVMDKICKKDEKLFLIQQKNPFPILNQRILQEKYSKTDKNININTFIKELDFNFAFYEKDLEILNKITPKNEEEALFITKYVLYSYITWYSHVEKTKSAAFCDLVLVSLNHVLEFKQTNTICKTFIYTVAISFSASDFSETKVVLQQLKQFFEKIKNIEVDYYEILVFIGNFLLDDRNDDKYGYIPFLITVLSQHKDISQSAAGKILVKIRERISLMEIESLKLFALLMKSLDKMTKDATFEAISITLLSFITKVALEIKESDNQLLFDDWKSTVTIAFNFLMIDMFNNDFVLPEADFTGVIPDDPEKVFKGQVDDIINIFVEVAEQSSDFYEEIIKKIIKMVIISNNTELEKKAVVFMLVLCYNMYKIDIDVSSSLDFFIDSFLFQKQFFTNDLYNLRFMAYNLIFSNQQSAVKLINTLIPSPLQLLELVKLCAACPKNIAYTLGHSRKVSKALSNGILKLHEISSSNTKIVEKIRAETISYTMILLNNEYIANRFFSDSTFTISWIFLAYQIPIRERILEFLQKYLISTNNFNQVDLIQNIAYLFTSGKLETRNEDAMIYLNRILLMLNKVLLDNPQHQHVFSELSSSLVSFLEVIAPTDQCRELIVTMIAFFSELLPVYKLSSYNIQSITAAVSKLYKEPSVKVRDALFSFLVKNTMISNNDMMIIQEAKAAGALLNIFKDTEYIFGIIDKMIDLCKLSKENCIKMHNDEVNLLILDLIIELWDTNDEKSTKKITKFFELFVIINKVISSSVIVFRFISLLCPFEGKYLSRHISKAISILKNFLHLNLSLPKTFTYITQKSELSPRSPIEQKDGITAFIWVKKDIRSLEHSSKIVTIESGSNIFSLLLNYQHLSILTAFKGEEDTVSEANRICSDQWELISLSLTFKDNSTVIRISTETETVEKTVNLSFKEPLKVSFCGMFQDNKTPEHPDLLGPFSIFPLISNEEVDKIMQKDYKDFNQIDLKLIYGVQNLSLEVAEEPTFTNILLKICKVDSILPLLSYAELNYKDGEMKENIIFDVLDILTLSLKSGTKVEMNFTKSEGFGLINYILSMMPPKVLTYEVYLKFYEMLKIMKSHELKVQIVGCILFNMKFWSECDVETQRKIQKHWIIELFPQYLSVILYRMTFSSIFAAMITSYTNYSSSSDKITKKEYAVIRSSIYQLLISIAPHSFNFESYENIISFCVQLASNEISIEVLHMFKQIILVTPTPFIEVMKHQETVPLLYKFLNTKSGTVVAAVFDCLAFMDKTRILKENLFVPISISMLSIVHKEAFNHELFHLVADIVANVTSDLFIICCIIALKVGEDACRELLSSIRLRKNFLKPSWIPFILLLFKQLPKEDLYILADFIIECRKEDWISIFDAIEVIGLFFGSEKDNLSVLFINSLINTIMKEGITPKDPQFNQFASIAAKFLFFRESPGYNIALLCQLQDQTDGFVDIMATVRFLKLNRHYSLCIDEDNFTVAEYFNLFDQDGEKPLVIGFGLRFNQSGEWVDERLAVSCAKILVKSNKTNAVLTVMMICAFLASRNEKLINEVVPQIVLPEKHNSKVTGVADFLYYKLLVINKAQLFNYEPENSSFDGDAVPLFINACHFNYTESFVIIKDIKKLWEEASSLSKKQKHVTDDINLKEKASFVDTVKFSFSKWHEHVIKLWRHSWGYMTLEKAPWEKAMPRNRHFKRDNTLCFAKCPFKLKPNIDFDDHIIASKARDEMKGKEKRPGIRKSTSWVKSVSVEIKHQAPSKILLSAKCIVVKLENTLSAKFDMHPSDFSLSYSDTHVNIYKYSSITSFTNQTYLHHQTAVEVFFENGHSLFISFDKHEERNQVIKLFQSKIKTLSLNALSELPSEKTRQWQEGEISNFEYLLFLNRQSGRTFLNQMQYPIFPWVLTDYKSDKLDFNNPSIFRDFTKPVGALNPKRLEDIESLECSFEQSDGLYNSAMSCPLILYVMMVRVEPFTTLHIQMQSGRFDVPERLFSSIEKMHKNSLTDPNDVRELIPEFFFMPEFLLNLNKFDLGYIDDVKMSDVVLPPWAKNPVEFVYLHRKALESDYVSSNINNWIDLIWGYKQRGKEAVACKNLFPSYLYDDIWTPENLNDESKRSTIEISKKHLGQIPLQLFTTPHPKKKINTQKKDVLKSYRFQASTSRLLFATIDQEKINEITVTFIDEEGLLSKFYCMLSEADDSSVSTSSIGSEPQVKILNTNDEKATAFGILPGNIYLTFGPTINIYDANKGTITLLSESAQCWAVSGEWLAIIGLDSTLKIYNAKNPTVPHSTTPFQRDLARCCCVSPEFHVVVVASRDGGVVVHSLENGFPVRAIDLGDCTPMNVCVSPSWGFIVIYLTRIEENRLVHVLSVYTINGIFVREQRILSPIAKMTCWKSPKGFDYIAISSERGSISTAEIFYLDFGKPDYRLQSRIVALEFNEKMGTIIAVSDDGKIFSEFYSYKNAK